MSFSPFYDLLAFHNRDRKSNPYVYRDSGKISLHFDFAATQSTMLEADPYRLCLGYTRSMMGCLLFNSRPANIGMIGLGGGSLAKYCYQHFPEACIDIAEINPEVIEMRDRFLIPHNDERFTVSCCDGAEFIAQSSTAYDWLMVDGFDINGQAPSLVTPSFYEDCHSALGATGVLIVNMDSDDPEHDKYVGTLRQCFSGAVLLIRSQDSANKIAFAFRDKSMLASSAEWLERARALEATHSLDLRKTSRDLQTSKSRDKRFFD